MAIASKASLRDRLTRIGAEAWPAAEMPDARLRPNVPLTDTAPKAVICLIIDSAKVACADATADALMPLARFRLIAAFWFASPAWVIC